MWLRVAFDTQIIFNLIRYKFLFVFLLCFANLFFILEMYCRVFGQLRLSSATKQNSAKLLNGRSISSSIPSSYDVEKVDQRFLICFVHDSDFTILRF